MRARTLKRSWFVAALVVGAAAPLAAAPPAPAAPAARGPGGPAPLPAIPPTGRVLRVPIQGDIDLGLAPFVQRALGGVGPGDLVILDVNTFGGRIDAAVVIRDALLSCRARTVAFVDRRAISAGALISLGADVIAMTSGATIGAATPVQIEGGQMKPVEAKVVSYMRKEMKATAEAKGRRGDLAEAMVDAAVEIPGLDTKEQTLTLTTAEALRWGVAALEARDLPDLLGRLGRPGATVERLEVNWAEQIARFLSSTAVSGLLMTLGMLGLLIELYHPTHFLAAGVGLACLGLFFFGHLVVRLAGWEELALFGAGVLLLGLEVFVIPGFGLAGVLGIAAVVGSLVMALVSLDRVPFDVGWSLGWIPHALTVVFGSITATAVLAVVAVHYLPRTAIGRPLILQSFIAGRAGAAAPPGVRAAVRAGQTGTSATACRPAGKALVDGRRVDVVADGDYLEPDEPIEVVRVEGARVVVRRIG